MTGGALTFAHSINSNAFAGSITIVFPCLLQTKAGIRLQPWLRRNHATLSHVTTILANGQNGRLVSHVKMNEPG